MVKAWFKVLCTDDHHVVDLLNFLYSWEHYDFTTFFLCLSDYVFV